MCVWCHKIILQILFNIARFKFLLAHLDVGKLALDLSIHFFMPHNVKQKDEQSLKQWTRKWIKFEWSRFHFNFKSMQLFTVSIDCQYYCKIFTEGQMWVSLSPETHWQWQRGRQRPSPPPPLQKAQWSKWNPSQVAGWWWPWSDAFSEVIMSDSNYPKVIMGYSIHVPTSRALTCPLLWTVPFSHPLHCLLRFLTEFQLVMPSL